MAIVKNSIKFSTGGGSEITVVANYSALPDPTTVSGEFYWCSASQGTSWLPGSLGGTYYNSGLYYSNGTTWEFLNVPFNATQAEVNTGTNNDKFVTPKTFTDASKWGTKQDTLTFDSTPTDGSSNPVTSDGIFGAITVKTIYLNASDSTPSTGSTSEIIHDTIFIPANTIPADCVLTILTKAEKNNDTGTFTIKYQKNSSASLSGATPLGLFTTGTTTTRLAPLFRNFNIRGGNMICYPTGSSALNDYAVATANPTSVPFDVTVDNYILVTLTAAAAATVKLNMTEAIVKKS